MFKKFIRPEGSAYPQTYHSFIAKKLDSDDLVTYHIVDLLPKDSEEAIDLMMKYFIPDEVFNNSAKISEKPEALAILSHFYKEIIGSEVSLGCYDSETGELVGANMLLVKKKGEKSELEIGNADLEAVMEMYFHVEGQFDVCEHYGVDQFLYGAGLVVNSAYRGRGIATELLKARFPLLRSLGLKVTSTVFTMAGSQKAAEKAGYEELFAISYKELQEKFPNLNLSTANSSHCKTSGIMIEEDEHFEMK